MSLEHAFKRLTVRPASVCHECRRAFGSSPRSRQQQSATSSLADSLLSSRRQRAAESPRPTARIATATTPSSAAPLGDTSPALFEQPYERARQLINTATASSKQASRTRDLADLERQFTRRDLEQQITRRFKPGDVYAPHDLSGVEMAKWKKLRRKPKSRFDVLDQLNINPLDHYKNFSIMSEYITPMGRIRHSNDTGLRPVNQRKMAKAIRRAMGMGLMPGVHRHPEVLKAEMAERRPPSNYR